MAFLQTFNTLMQHFAGSLLAGVCLLSLALLVSFFRQHEDNRWINWSLLGLAALWMITPSAWQLLFPHEESFRAVLEARQLPSATSMLIARFIGLCTGAAAVQAFRIAFSRW